MSWAGVGWLAAGWLAAAVVAALLWILFRRTERRHVRTDPDEMPTGRGWGGRAGG